MNIIGDVLKELGKMFVADLRLTLATLFSVVLVAAIMQQGWVDAAIAGLLLTLLCIAVLAEAILREVKKRKHR
ncbi:MAG TPA: hypothetical protein ENH56_12730 [Roseobacter sp.]|uniref:Uncharacterized protein n=1 Tax=marine sediment metagenome TaxID=412755 RepID=A0A0F9JS17_9ZZZZ|nr:hypothetical protein [Roseobacter sp.]HEC70242.1 hypothetical protein [Roseobacter sp.]|tara:strand:- start:11665 stop:11883 length:219 start_codon:yes stop_codon:yes gene_type:complete